MKIPRINNITQEEFIQEYIVGNKPVIVTDAMENWDMSKFTPEYFKEAFGEEKVQVYDDLFNLQNIQSLKEYIDANFFRNEEDGLSDQYMRWYTKLKEVEYYWSDKVFDALKNAWSHPYFIPNTSLVIPSNKEAEERVITDFHYPYKGLFISGKGSRTRLHKDPFTSNAVLCQFYGEKKIYLFAPSKEASVMKDGAFVDVKNPDHDKFPDYKNITHDYEDTLSPGEIVFFPSGWFHDVTCETDSISITWNFVHETQLDIVCKHIAQNPNDDQLEIAKFFLKGEIKDNANARDIILFLKKKFKKAKKLKAQV
ncbi:cupin-like domain-containing protein [Tenacibaculum sp. 190524A02b]|uniref:cupin-like domain-containing protein n=1 Tax=Tenacibaculum vairaonense TaxID=3137860 RepID=UPI0031FA50B9